MLKDKNFTTFEEQIKILKGRKLTFINEEGAIDALRRYGYYNIINGYKDPYVHYIEEDGEQKEFYNEGVTFEQVFSLYMMDRYLRSAVMDAMLEVEDNLKTVAAHTIGEVFSAELPVYLSRTNYKPGKPRKDGSFQIDGVMAKFQKVLDDEMIAPIQFYKDKYNNVPPWILFKGASLGNIVNFIKLQKSPQKTNIISLIYAIPYHFAENQEIRDLFMDTIFACLDFRNCVAHGGRTYNHCGKASFRYNKLLHSELDISEADYRNGKGKRGLIPLLAALKIFDNSNISRTLSQGVEFFAELHLEKYPDDEDYLAQFLPIENINLNL